MFLRAPALLALFAFALPAVAQFDPASVLGTVRDVKGGSIVTAAVTLENINTGFTAKTNTDSSGEYLFPSVKIGTYKVSAEMQGFSTAVADNVVLTINARQRVDITLQVGSVTETVNVVETAPLLESDSSSKGQVITQKQIVNLPILGRSYSNLALLVPGVRQSQSGNQGDIPFRREGSYNVNRTTNQGFSNQATQPSPDSVAEFRMSINAYSAEYGRTGGAVMNVSSRSGANEIHGSVWDYLQNTKLNAYGFFRPRDAVGREFPKPQVNRNQFGFVFGGPLLKNRTFYFADYEGSRWIQSPFGQATIPTVAQRHGVLATATRIPYAYVDSTGAQRSPPAGSSLQVNPSR